MDKVNIKSEAKFSFLEATGVLLGHEVGAGILTIPFLASLNNWYDFIWILIVTMAINTLLHLMIAELSLNNGGKQFVECMKNELFRGKENKTTKIITWIIFGFLLLSVVINCTAYITGASTVLNTWLQLPPYITMLIYYVFAGLVVFFGMKVVGISEKISSYILIGTIVLLSGIMLFLPSSGELTYRTGNISVVLGLYSIVSFAMSAVMSVPTVVKGLNGDAKKIRWSIILSEMINTLLIILLTVSSILGVGASYLNKNDPVTVSVGLYIEHNLSSGLGKAINIIGKIFTIFAYTTSLWANTLDLRDMVSEQTKLNKRLSWLISSLPSLLLSIVCVILTSLSLSKLSVLAGGVQVLTAAAITISFMISRKKSERLEGFEVNKTITGRFGAIPFGIIVILSSLVATIGSVVY